MTDKYVLKICRSCGYCSNDYDLQQKKVPCIDTNGKPNHTTVFKSIDNYNCNLHQKTVNENDCCDNFNVHERYSTFGEYLLLTPKELKEMIE